MALFTFGGLGLFALITGVVLGFKRSELLRSGLRTQGVVVDQFKSVSSTIGEGTARITETSVSYYPVVEFLTQRGATIRFRGATGSGVPDYETGAVVKVVYRPDDPQQAKILTFSQFWLGPLVVTVAVSRRFFRGNADFILIHCLFFVVPISLRAL